MRRIVLHIDFDSFFASCEQQFNPKLRNRPIGVTATNGRTAVIAASREAKKLGVKNVMRTFDAQNLCPDIVFVPAHFEKYWQISKKFIAIAKDYSPDVEVFSLDEIFMDVTKTAHLFGGVHSLIDGFKQRLTKEVGVYITVSVGISHNKLLAKLASGLKKPNGIVAITPENIWDVYAQAKLTDVCGIGERIRIRLNSIGIFTLLDLKKASVSTLIAEFGKVEGIFLKSIGEGIDERRVISYTEEQVVKSTGRNYCLPHNEYDRHVVLQNVYELCEEVGIKLRRLKKCARTVGLSLRGSYSVFGRETFAYSFDTGKQIYRACTLIREREERVKGEHWNNTSYVRQISVWAGNLEDIDSVQLAFFEDAWRRYKVTKTIDEINDRFGDHTIRNAFLLYADKLTTKPNGFMADKYEREVLRFEF